MSDSKDPKETPKDHDVVLLHSPTEDGEGVRALRSRPGRLDVTEIRQMEEGKPLDRSADVVSLHPREDAPALCDVEVHHEHRLESEPSTTPHAGPPRVSNDTYRQNWERVFGRSRRVKPGKHELN